jgi:hypothetical protein
MKVFCLILLISVTLLANFQNSQAQNVDKIPLIWEKKTIDLGAVLEEGGDALVEFKGKNVSDRTLVITDVIPDCGCTTVHFSSDSILPGDFGTLRLKFDPENKGGNFKKNVLVRTSLDIYGDSLSFEGIYFPLVESPEKTYVVRNGDIGMRLPVINFGEVYQNQPKTKFVEIYNFSKKTIDFSSIVSILPKHIQIQFSAGIIPSHQRSILEITYDGQLKDDLGFFEERLELQSRESNSIPLHLTATVFEYYPPIPKSRVNEVAKLGISEVLLDFREISANSVIERHVLLSNLGMEPLEIKKIISNCECLKAHTDVNQLNPGESTKLFFNFNPKGRRGIDQRNITIYSNDPLNPVRTIVLRSYIK